MLDTDSNMMQFHSLLVPSLYMMSVTILVTHPLYTFQNSEFLNTGVKIMQSLNFNFKDF